MRPRDIGTAAETAVVKALRTHGFPTAERRALHGAVDLGDITGCPGLVFEVKGGQAARTASDGLIASWLAETETERIHAGADLGVLVVQRAGIGPANAGRWWAVVWLDDLVNVCGAALGWDMRALRAESDRALPVRLHLTDLCALLVAAGYGSRPDTEGAA